MVTVVALTAALLLGLTAGWQGHHLRTRPALTRLAAYDRAAARDVEYRQAVPKDWFDRQINRANTSAIHTATHAGRTR